MSYGRQFIRELKREIRAAQRGLARGWTTGMVNLRNFARRMREFELDYVALSVGGPLPERSAPPRSFIQRQLPLPPEPLSMQVLNYRLRRVAEADNVRGVVLIFEELYAGLATLQNLRQSIHRLRQAGKEVIVYTPYLDMEHYFVAAAADRIIAPPVADFAAIGVLRLEVFGSATRSDCDPACSNFDFVLDLGAYQPGISRRFVAFADGLESLLEREVDLVFEERMRPHFRQAVDQTGEVIFEAGDLPVAA